MMISESIFLKYNPRQSCTVMPADGNYIQLQERQTKSALPLLCNRGRRFIAGGRFEHTTYQIFVSGSAWPIIDKS